MAEPDVEIRSCSGESWGIFLAPQFKRELFTALVAGPLHASETWLCATQEQDDAEINTTVAQAHGLVKAMLAEVQVRMEMEAKDA